MTRLILVIDYDRNKFQQDGLTDSLNEHLRGICQEAKLELDDTPDNDGGYIGFDWSYCKYINE